MVGSCSRLIPARAGRTPVGGHTSRGRRAHPRSCGADVDALRGGQLFEGSSPLVRGGRGWLCCRRCLVRLIPARAGRTRVRDSTCTPIRAHPRSCGADAACLGSDTEVWGSSPLVRGGLGPPPRKTPARRAHPRSCGADRVMLRSEGAGLGSSPLVRGGRPECEDLPIRRGLIPARAGRTESGKLNYRRARAHPRSCGADNNPARSTTRSPGSSPLVRGGPGRHPGDVCLAVAHPRSCGADSART